MYFEWDESKRLSNVEKHMLDFMDAPLVYDGPHLRALARPVKGEERWQVTGLLDDVYVTMIYTLRGDAVRIISMRRTRYGEKRKHRAVFGH